MPHPSNILSIARFALFFFKKDVPKVQRLTLTNEDNNKYNVFKKLVI